MNLPPLPARMSGLPASGDGLVVPWMLGDDGRARKERLRDATGKRLCRACGEPIGVYACFLVAMDQALTRNAAALPCHLSCAEYMVAGGTTRFTCDPAPFELVGIWSTKAYREIWVSVSISLINLDPPTSIAWSKGGKPVPRDEIIAAINQSLGPLVAKALIEGEMAQVDIIAAVKQLNDHLPA